MLRFFSLRFAAMAPHHNLRPSVGSFSPTRPFSSSQGHQVALQMIQYAMGHARSQRSGGSYAEALMVLEQGLANLKEGGGLEGDTIGMLENSMATLLHERGQSGEALDKLKMARELTGSSIAMRVAAYEGLVGLNLEAGEDVSASITADECLQILQNRQESGPVSDEVTFLCKGIKGLVHLTTGDLKAAESMFCGSEHHEPAELGDLSANNVLSYGEFLHASGDFSSAKDFYERALQVSQEKNISERFYTPAANMVSEEALVGAACSLGQLLSDSGNFQDAEEMLTKALTNAEENFGQNHPKVGIVLTCMAIMFGRRAQIERSSSLLIQEGLFRKAIDLLKAPPLGEQGIESPVSRRDIVALARGGYGEILCVQHNRKMEGESMKRWAEANWRNRRLTLAEALDFSETSRAAVVDTRISRVI